jgi:lipopolysaccharide export system permease protein
MVRFATSLPSRTRNCNLPGTPLDLASRTKNDTEMNIAEATQQLELMVGKGVMKR